MTQAIPNKPRPLDHLVLPTADLDVARARLTALGFTVAPEGIHPFGTWNCCVYFSDGTFLEPLAQLDQETETEAARRGNVFAARDIAYRFRRGDEGFSAVVFGTEDAEADHAAIAEAGLPGGPMLDFSRDFIDAEGRRGTASFRLAFAADLRAPDCFFFTCQRVGVPNVDRAALQQHANGVKRIASVVLAAAQASPFGPLVSAAAGAEPAGIGPGCEDIILDVGNATIELWTNQELHRRFGPLSAGDRGLQARAIVFGVPDLKATKSFLVSMGINCEEFRGRLVVPPAPGQGAIFAFEEAA